MFQTEVGSTCQTTQVRTERMGVGHTVLIIAGNIARITQDNTAQTALEATFQTTGENTGRQHSHTFTLSDQKEVSVSHA